MQKKSGLSDSIDMNYIHVSWSAGGSDTISGRTAVMYEDGKSHWGAKLVRHTLTVYPSKNSSTTYDVPDSWEPVWEGLIGARSEAKVSHAGKTYTLKVDCRLTP